jgi:hypothetical protein
VKLVISDVKSSEIERKQIEICRKNGVVYEPFDFGSKLGVSDNLVSGLLPLNGLRHPPEGDTSGWYLWAGEELSTAADFFKPMHANHLIKLCPDVMKYLAFPPGWRFLVAGFHEDIWFDEELLNL